MDDVTPVKGYVVRDDVLYLITGGSEDLAFLLARNSPVTVSAVVHERSTRDVHASAQRMLKRAANSDVLPKQLAQDVIAMAQAGGMPDTYWQTDRRIARACEVLGVTPETARELSAKAFEEAEDAGRTSS